MFRLPIVKFFSRILNRATITIVLVALQVLWLLWAFWAFTAGRVWLNGALRPILGRLSMDLLAVDVTGADVSPGDRVELFGPNLTLDDAAAALDISRNTARSQLQAVFRKTGVSRQSELVLLLLGSVATLSG